MKIQLNTYTPLRGYILEESLEKGTPRYIIEIEFEKWCELHAGFFIQRYKEGKGEHWTEKEKRNTYVGLAAQRAFDMLLSKMVILRDSNDPMLDMRQEKDYDVLTPIGKIEVKGVDHYCEVVLVKISEWHHSEFLVVWKLNKAETELEMLGWQSRIQVEAYPQTPKGATKYNPLSDSYVIPLSDLNQPPAFIQKLKQQSLAKEK